MDLIKIQKENNIVCLFFRANNVMTLLPYNVVQEMKPIAHEN